MSHTIVAIEGLVADELDRAFQKFVEAAKKTAVLDLSSVPQPGRHLVEPITTKLRACPELQTLVLVHPSPVLGIVASSFLLGVPRVTVKSCASVDELST